MSSPDPTTTAHSLIALAWELREELPHAPQLTEHPAEPLYSYQIRDRLEDCGLHGSWEAFTALFGINPTCVGGRPKAHARFYMSAPGLLAADFALLLAQLASWGLPIDPTSWVDALRPALLKRHAITHGELRVLWFPREHRSMKLGLEISAWPDNVPSSFVTANGRRIRGDYGWVRSSPAPCLLLADLLQLLDGDAGSRHPATRDRRRLPMGVSAPRNPVASCVGRACVMPRSVLPAPDANS